MAKICPLTSLLLFLTGATVPLSATDASPIKPQLTSIENSSLTEEEVSLRHVVFLISRGEMKKAIEKYLSIYEETGKHDHEILKQLSTIILENGLSSRDVESQLLSLFGVSLANDPSFIHFFEYALKSHHPLVQAASLHLLASLHEDVADSLIQLGMRSDYLMIRFEALSLLVGRKSTNALGQAESLMNLLHPQFRPFFMEFYASYGSPEAISFLKQMTSDRNDIVRRAAILAAAKFGRDDLLPNIRKAITHSDPALKECAATAAGALKDLGSVENLKITAISPFPETKLAALHALYKIGEPDYEKEIVALAKEKNLYAIQLLGSLKKGEDLLIRFTSDENDEVRLNAAMALLQRRSSYCYSVIRDILSADDNHIGFAPFISPGNSLVCWKIVPLASVTNNDQKQNLRAITFNLQEEVLTKSIDLPRQTFLQLATFLLREKKNSLVPTLMRLLENTATEQASELLKQFAESPGAPLVRAYCNLALYRLDASKEQKDRFLAWLSTQKPDQLIEFRPMMERGARQDRNVSNFNLTPEERSGLLIESYFSISDKHEPDGITLILKAMRDGHENNRFPLAGLLLKSVL